MTEEYMNLKEIRILLRMPEYECTIQQVITALEEYNKSNYTNIILIEE